MIIRLVGEISAPRIEQLLRVIDRISEHDTRLGCIETCARLHAAARCPQSSQSSITIPATHGRGGRVVWNSNGHDVLTSRSHPRARGSVNVVPCRWELARHAHVPCFHALHKRRFCSDSSYLSSPREEHAIFGYAVPLWEIFRSRAVESSILPQSALRSLDPCFGKTTIRFEAMSRHCMLKHWHFRVPPTRNVVN